MNKYELYHNQQLLTTDTIQKKSNKISNMNELNIKVEMFVGKYLKCKLLSIRLHKYDEHTMNLKMH